MKDLKCINCDTPNLVTDITEPFKCGECGEVNPGIDVDTLHSDYQHLLEAYSELSDRLKTRNNEVWRLCRLLDENNIKYEVG